MAPDPRADSPEVTKQIGIRLPVRIAEKLEAMARRESNGVSAVCRRLLSSGLALEERRSAL